MDKKMSALIFAQRYAFSIYSCLTSSSLLLEYALIEYIKGSIPNGNDTSVIIIDRANAVVNFLLSLIIFLQSLIICNN